MNTLPRLADHTAALESMHALNAMLVTALCKHHLGPMAADDPALLEDFLAARRVPSPVRTMVKAAVSAGTTTDATWAGPLAPVKPMVQAFIGAVDRRSVLGQLGAVKVPVGNAIGATQTATATASWVGEQTAKPLSALAFAALSLPARKCVADVAVTIELLKMASADALALVQRSVVSAVASALDDALLDPANAGVVNVKPAALTNGLVAVTPAGDFANNVGQVLAAISGGAPTRPVIVVSLQTALRLTALRDLQAIGVNVIVTPAAGARVIAIDADGVAYSDDGGDERIGEPDVQMDSAPTSPSTASTVMVSSFQRNQKVVRAERWVNWAKRADAVAYLTLA